MLECTGGNGAVCFDSLFAGHAHRVRGLVRGYVRDPHMAEDIVQETFLRVFRSLPSLDRDRDPWPWLATIATRLCRDHAHRASTVHETPGAVELELPHGIEPDPEEWCLAQEHAGAVREALGRLNPRHRRLLVLREVEGLAYRAIARVEGASTNALKVATHRAREAFREAYAAVMTERGLNVAAWPVVGAITSRWRALRTRLQEYAGQVSGAVPAGPLPMALAAGAASVALVVAMAMSPLDATRGETDGRRALASAVPESARAHELARSAHGQLDERDGTTTTPRRGVASVRISAGDVSDDAPVMAGLSVRVERDEARWTVEDENEGVNGDEDSSGGGQTWVECESGSVTTRVLCDALDTGSDLLAGRA